MANQGAIQKAVQTPRETPQKNNYAQIMNSVLDSENLRKRFDEVLGKRAPQFMSSLIALVNSDKFLQRAMLESPLSVIQAALKAATFDLPIDPGLGYAYIVPFNNKQDDGTKRMEGNFILGYKGMNQLALRTGMYKNLNVIDVREGELKSYNRLTGDVEINFIEDEEEREGVPIVGYVGYFRLLNGFEKTIYRSCKQLDAHERKHRKGQYMGKGWKEMPEEMRAKTVFRELIGKHGIMSIEYQRASTAFFEEDQSQGALLIEGGFTGGSDGDAYTDIDTETGEIIDAQEDGGGTVFDAETGEVIEQVQQEAAPDA